MLLLGRTGLRNNADWTGGVNTRTRTLEATGWHRRRVARRRACGAQHWYVRVGGWALCGWLAGRGGKERRVETDSREAR
jgi:hypothetical protein